MDPCSLMYISIYQSVKSYDGHNATFRQHCTLPSEGFTTKYDPLNEYIAIGCNNGSKLLFSIAESMIIVMKIK